MRVSNSIFVNNTQTAMLDFSFLGSASRVFSSIANLKDRLMSTVPIVNAQVLPPSLIDVKNSRLYLIRIDIYPARRQAVFDRVSVTDCRLIPFETKKDESCRTLYTPKYEGGFSNAFPLSLIVPPESAQAKPISLMFFVEPNKNTRVVKVKLHSPHFFASTSCDVRLTKQEGPEVSFLG